MSDFFNLHFLVVQQYAVHFCNSVFRGFLGVEVNKAVPFGRTVLCLSNLTRQDIPEGTKGVVQRFIVDAFIKILDENVTDTRLSKRRVSLCPRDSARSSLDRIEIHGFESSFG